jgi:hypothetical protein
MGYMHRGHGLLFCSEPALVNINDQRLVDILRAPNFTTLEETFL